MQSERQVSMRIGKPDLCVRLAAVIGALALGSFLACPCAAAGESLEPLADHLSPPAFTADHQAWLKDVIAEIPVLTRQIQALPAGVEPSKAEALKTRLATLRAERQGLEAHRQLWETYRQTTDSTAPSIVQGGKPTPALNRQALFKVYKDYFKAKRSMDDAGIGTPWGPSQAEHVRAFSDAQSAQVPEAPSMSQWEDLADQFERLLRTAQTTEGLDGSLALHGRLQGSC